MQLESLENHPIELSSSDFEEVDCSELFESEDIQESREIEESNGCEGIKTEFERTNNSFERPEILTDLEVTKRIADYIETVSEFRYENWSKLDLEQRKLALNRVEQDIAAIEHRPALRVDIEHMEPRRLGYQSSYYNKIALNDIYVSSNDPNMFRKVLETIIHEGRHAYQHYNVDVKMIHESGSEVNTWRENFYDPRYRYYQSTGQKIMIPLDGSYQNVEFRLYYYQPVEIDARNFTNDVLSKLRDKGFV